MNKVMHKKLGLLLGCILLVSLFFLLIGCDTANGSRYYTVTFETNGGSSMPSLRVIDGGHISTPQSPTKQNYFFVNWYSNSGLTKQVNFNDYVVHSDVTLYAKWVQGYTVTFETNSTWNISNIYIKEGAKITRPTDPKKQGYIFVNWYLDIELTIIIDFNNYVVNSDVTLYAKWEVQNVVTFQTNGGSIIASIFLVSGSKITRPTDPTKQGYIFVNWYLDIGLTTTIDFNNYVVNSDVTLYAGWIKSYTVTFNTNGGSNISELVIPEGSLIARPADPSKYLCEFINWYSDTGLTVLFDFDTPISSNINLYAKWVVTEIEITYVITVGQNVVVPNPIGSNNYINYTPARRGYTFDGWYLSSSGSYMVTGSLYTNTTLYAHWITGEYLYTISENEIAITSFIKNSETSISVPSTIRGISVTTIAGQTFLNSSSLKTIIIPNSINEIGNETFRGCSSLVGITLPFVGQSRTSTYAEALFGYVFGTTSYTGGTKTTQYNNSTSYVYNYIPTSLKNVTITDIPFISDYAFYGCSLLTSIVIPSYVMLIGTAAFRGCSNITSFTIPSSVTSIGGGAFSGCSSLVSVVIPSSVTSIEDSTFYWCTSLVSVTIPNSVISIGTYAFTYCTSLTSIVIPNSVTTIGYNSIGSNPNLTIFCQASSQPSGWSSLWNFDSLTSVNFVYWNFKEFGSNSEFDYFITNNDKVGILKYKLNSSSLVISTVDDYGVVLIGHKAFNNHTSLTSIVIPDSVTSIEGGAFSGCLSLASITLPFVGQSRYASNELSLFGYIFGTFTYTGGTPTTQYYNSSSYVINYIPLSLRNVIITNTTSINYGAFYNCVNLTSIVISNYVTTITGNAFYNCLNLVIFSESSFIPSGWNSSYNPSNRPVYLVSQWHYDAISGLPTPNN
jgi:uncharacterized repeat protein (TIGR02543 family)